MNHEDDMLNQSERNIDNRRLLDFTNTSYAIWSIVVMAEICRRVTLYTLDRISSLLLDGRYIQLFREWLSEKVHATRKVLWVVLSLL